MLDVTGVDDFDPSELEREAREEERRRGIA
jgi:hypothetical protein